MKDHLTRADLFSLLKAGSAVAAAGAMNACGSQPTPYRRVDEFSAGRGTIEGDLGEDQVYKSGTYRMDFAKGIFLRFSEQPFAYTQPIPFVLKNFSLQYTIAGWRADSTAILIMSTSSKTDPEGSKWQSWIEPVDFSSAISLIARWKNTKLTTVSFAGQELVNDPQALKRFEEKYKPR